MIFPTGFDADLLQALIFDVDDTLADTERDVHRVAFNRAFRQARFDWDWDVATYGQLLKIAGGKEHILHYIHTAAPDAVGRDCKAMTRMLHALKTRTYVKLLENREVALRPASGSQSTPPPRWPISLRCSNRRRAKMRCAGSR